MLEGVSTLERKIKATELGKNLFIGRERNKRKKRIYIHIYVGKHRTAHRSHRRETKRTEKD